ncbi:Peripla_BP_1 domain-containing protein [Ectopseudomonas oleovorans]|uniref:Periplasmic binding protein/LacI sugar binding domain-containing protein n=1 Tax=Ectopseudomonas oleovorans TaxID=301 RepID=A0A653B5N8_ECTOL|nr:Peripla_BP_1 domain-containing protein [Pseudomonas oleovorans]
MICALHSRLPPALRQTRTWGGEGATLVLVAYRPLRAKDGLMRWISLWLSLACQSLLAAEWFPYPVQADGRMLDYRPLPAAAQPWRICALLPHGKDRYWWGVAWGLDQEAQRLGVRLGIYEAGGYEHGDVQLEQFDRCVAEGADAFVVASINKCRESAVAGRKAGHRSDQSPGLHGAQCPFAGRFRRHDTRHVGLPGARQWRPADPGRLVARSGRCRLGAGCRARATRGAGWQGHHPGPRRLRTGGSQPSGQAGS